MKRILLLLVVSLIISSCKKDLKNNEKSTQNLAANYESFGKQIADADALNADRMLVYYKGMKQGDTVNSKMKAKIVDVCTKKGCWMTLDIGEEQQVMVKFKDYGFFVPTDAKGEVIVNGKAFIAKTSVEELRHYAEDAGKSKDDIAKITEPKVEYRFEADGVLLKR